MILSKRVKNVLKRTLRKSVTNKIQIPITMELVVKTQQLKLTLVAQITIMITALTRVIVQLLLVMFNIQEVLVINKSKVSKNLSQRVFFQITVDLQTRFL